MNKLYEYKGLTMPLEIKDVDSKQGIITGYFAAFNTVDSDRDVIRKGAFATTIRNQGPNSKTPRIRHLLNHNPSEPLGELQSLKEDDYGLLYESKIGSHNLGQDFLKMVESNLVKEHSIGYSVVKRNQVGQWDDPKGGAVWELTELKLYEGSSLTGWGANQYTPLLGAKGEIDIDRVQEQISNLEKFCRNTDATDQCIELCLLEIKQLGALVQAMSSNQSVDPPKGLKNAEILLLNTSIEQQLLNLQTWN
jgi:HK97 family phage prohead protease